MKTCSNDVKAGMLKDEQLIRNSLCEKIIQLFIQAKIKNSLIKMEQLDNLRSQCRTFSPLSPSPSFFLNRISTNSNVHCKTKYIHTSAKETQLMIARTEKIHHM